MLTDNAALISDLENDYKKLSVECKKKYNIIREVIDISMKAIEKLITIAQDKEKSQTFNQELSLSIEILLKPISIIVDSKHIKLFYYSIIIIKKLVTYNFVSVNESSGVISLLKELFDNSNEEIQLKILETIQSMVNSNKISPNEKIVSHLLSISCKMFGFKSIEFKNPIKLLFKTLVKENYDGYNFNYHEIYCPWDVVCFCKDALKKQDKSKVKTACYWNGTSSNDVIKEFLGFISSSDAA